MNDLKNGMLVQHASLGLGKIVALEDDAVHVFFETSEKRFATKLRLSMARPLLCAATTKNPWLKGMSTFALDPKTGRYALAQTWLPLDQAVARFTKVSPSGFGDPKSAAEGKEKGDRAAQWRTAHEAFAKAFGEGEGERLLGEGNVEELIRRAIRVERHVAALCSVPDKISMKEALCDPAASRDYFAALFEFLAAPGPDRAQFEHLAAAVAGLPQGASSGFAWVLCTLFPFIAQPDRHMLLRPKATCDIANRLGYGLSYDAAPNWPTYSALLRCTELLQGTLTGLGARDHVDVECFMHIIASKRASA